MKSAQAKRHIVDECTKNSLGKESESLQCEVNKDDLLIKNMTLIKI